jgi:uncharacterized membrane protein (UPF0127 family)
MRRLPAVILAAIATASLLAVMILTALCGARDAGAPTAIATATPEPATSSAGLRVIQLRHDGATLRVEVASTAEQRALGLGDRDSLDADAGMLLDLQQTRRASIWMKGMRFPLDIIYIREDGSVSSVTADVPPERGVADADLRMYPSEEPVRYVLEVNAGAAARLGIGPGDVLQFEAP